MIQPQTILKVADNSGAKTVKCIKILGNSKVAFVGDCILVSVRSLRSNVLSQRNDNQRSSKSSSRVQKGQIFKALVIRTKKGICNRPYGTALFFQSNDVVLIDAQGRSIGSRIFGPVTRELRALGHKAVISQSKKMV